MAQQNADAVHLGHHFVPKAAKPGIAALVATGTHQVLGVVGDLHDTHSQVLISAAAAGAQRICWRCRRRPRAGYSR
jgi:hypothetical protein